MMTSAMADVKVARGGKGPTIYSFARNHGISVDELMAENQWLQPSPPNYVLIPGTILRVPEKNEKKIGVADPSCPVCKSRRGVCRYRGKEGHLKATPPADEAASAAFESTVEPAPAENDATDVDGFTITETRGTKRKRTQQQNKDADGTQKEAELEQKNAKLTQEIAELMQKIADAELKNAELTKENADLTKENAELTKKIAELTQQIAELQKKVGHLVKALAINT